MPLAPVLECEGNKLQHTSNLATPANRTREQELARLVADHARLLYRVAFSVLRHAEDTEDAVQEALLKLLRAGELPAMADEKAYLARVVWRAALDRKAARKPGLEDETAPLRLPDHRPTPEAVAAERDERALLGEMIEALPDELREPLLLSAIEGLNSREVGDVLSLPEGTVRTRLMRARTALRDTFEATCRSREVAATGRSTR